MESTFVTVAICTFNRVGLLREALASLVRQETEGRFSWEILVIDNDPLGSAKSVVTDLCNSSPVAMRYIQEKNVGLSHARNRGIDESHGDIVAFLDDDISADKRWLEEMVATFERTGADCVGGRTPVKWEGYPIDSVKLCEAELVAFDMGDKDLPVCGRNLPIGANLAFCRSVFDEGHRFSTELGRMGSKLLGGEETELLLRLRRNGKTIWYSARSVVHHRMFVERLTERYYIKRQYWDGVCRAIIDTRLHYLLYTVTTAFMRTGKALLIDWPHLIIAKLMRHAGRRLLSTCKLAKCFGYWKGVLFIARRASSNYRFML